MRLKILYVLRSLAYYGGIERILVEKANYFSQIFGYDVYILTTDQGVHPIPYLIDASVHLEDLKICFNHQYQYKGLKRYWVAWRKKKIFLCELSKRIKLLSPNIIICTSANYVDLDIVVKAKGDIPLIIESHSILRETLSGKGLKGFYVNYMFNKSFKKARLIVSLTKGDALEWQKIHPLIVTIPNMIHQSECTKSSLDSKRIIFVGRFDYQKRPMEIIKIWHIVYPEFSDWHLDIYGDGEELQDLKTVTQSLNMNIHIHKPTNNIFKAYSNSSILVSTSLFEPFGLVILEAMSCGLPVVSYNCPFGPSSMIIDGYNGFLIENNNRSMFADRLSLLMSDKPLRQRMGQAATNSIQQFSPEHIMPRWKYIVENYSKRMSN